MIDSPYLPFHYKSLVSMKYFAHGNALLALYLAMLWG